MEPAAALVRRFNDAINAHDVDALAALMTDDHCFVDSEGATTAGKAACTEAWRDFLAGFPDYRNRFDAVAVDGDRVVVDGRSDCSVPELAGPARWHVELRDGRIARWQVEDRA